MFQILYLFFCTPQHDGGRKDRNLLLQDGDQNGKMDMEKVVDWVKHKKLSQSEQDNGPKGMERLRSRYADRENGNYPATPTENKYMGKMHIARIKPYIVSRHVDDWTNGSQHFPADKARIFAKAISNAMPVEKLDIMISRQSL